MFFILQLWKYLQLLFSFEISCSLLNKNIFKIEWFIMCSANFSLLFLNQTWMKGKTSNFFLKRKKSNFDRRYWLWMKRQRNFKLFWIFPFPNTQAIINSISIWLNQILNLRYHDLSPNTSLPNQVCLMQVRPM